MLKLVIVTVIENDEGLFSAIDKLLEFTDFAVAFCYEAFPDLEGDIDRRGCIDGVARLLQHVRRILAQTDL